MEAPTKGTFRLAGREFPAVTWYKDPALRRTYVCLAFVVLTSATNGYDGSMVNGLQSLDIWQDYFGHPTGSLLGLLACIMSVGSLVALPVVPYIADLLGRRWGIFIGCLIMILGVILQSISVNLKMFIAARFFLGFGIAIAHGASPLLITELTHPQHRATFTTIYNTTWYIGSFVAAWLTFGTNHINNDWCWRVPSLVQAFPSLLQMSFVWFVPESPRFLIAKGQVEKAHDVLAKVHANGDHDSEVVKLELQEIKDTIKLEQEFESNGWLELVKTKGNRHRLIILLSLGLFSQWSGNGLVSYYLNLVFDSIGITNSNIQLIINGCLQILNIIVATGQCFFVDKIGRRPLFLIATAGMLLVFIVWTICSAQFRIHGNESAANAVVAMIFLYYVFYNMAWSGLLVGYSAEILPYSIRAKGMTLMFLMVDIALFFNQYVNPIAMKNIDWKYYIVYDVWLAVELVVVYVFYIETRYTPLEEIVKHFDGDDAVVGGAAATEKSRQLAAEMGGLDTVNLDEKRPEVETREGPKTNCTSAKLGAVLTYMQKSRVAHTIKDLEKHLPSVAQINGMQVKDYVQTLQDESKIRAEKIGSGNWYWSFVSDDKVARQKALDAAQAAYDKALATDSELKCKLAEAEAQRKQDDEMLDEGGETREQLLGVKKLLENETEAVRRELATYSDNDPTELEKKAKEAAEWKTATEEYTDDIYSMEGWLKDFLSGNEGLTAILRDTYDREYDEEANGLKELLW